MRTAQLSRFALCHYSTGILRRWFMARFQSWSNSLKDNLPNSWLPRVAVGSTDSHIHKIYSYRYTPGRLGWVRPREALRVPVIVAPICIAVHVCRTSGNEIAGVRCYVCMQPFSYSVIMSVFLCLSSLTLCCHSPCDGEGNKEWAAARWDRRESRMHK